MTVEIGDTIETAVANPYPKILRVVLRTQQSVDYARKLVAEGKWRKCDPNSPTDVALEELLPDE